MANKLTAAKIEELWGAFCDKQTVRYVAKKCGVSETTVRRYRINGDWDARFDAIRRAANAKADESRAEMLARHAEKARAVQTKAMIKILEDGFATGGEAATAHFRATAEERLVRGEPTQRIEIIGQIQERHARRSKKTGK